METDQPTAPPAPIGEELSFLRTGDIAALFGVSERSVRQWADAGKLRCIRSPGGHRLFPTAGVIAALRAARPGLPPDEVERIVLAVQRQSAEQHGS